MLNSFAGLEMSKRALNTFRAGIETAGHNVSNVKTEGYSRQRVNLSTTDPYAAPGLSSPAIAGQIGTGVKIDEIVRIRDEFLDFQYRSELSALGYWKRINDMYNTVQLFIAEPQSSGVRASFDAFWEALSSLQKNPETPALRESVVQAANSLGAMIDTIVRGYDEYASMVNSEVKSMVDQANTILYQVAALNKEIYQVKALGQNPNDLLDKRDLLLDRLTEMLDVEIQEPYKNGNVTGEFFVTLNGRALIQGDKVRELAAHAFQWENQTYYDVQVRDNEFDIVENTNVALALATGPDGVHQLNVYRVANGEEWTVGGEDARCLNPNGSLKTVWTSGDIDAATLSGTFTVSSGGVDVEFTFAGGAVSHNGGGAIGPGAIANMNDLTDYMQSVFNDLGMPVTATPNGNSFTITSNADSVEINKNKTDTVNLTMTLSYVRMRIRPMSTTEALGISTSFRVQVGTQGARVASKIYTRTPNPAMEGVILGAGGDGDAYTFRVGAGAYQADVTVTWDSALSLPSPPNPAGATGGWVLTSDALVAPSTPVGTSSENLTVDELAAYLRQVLATSDPDHAFTVYAGGSGANGSTQFAIGSDNNYLISISDVVGDLAAQMGMVNPNPVITIDVDEADSLETIRNKINEKYQEAYGLTSPDQWVHASLEQDSDQSWYLAIASDVAGEAQRITIMGDESGDMQTLRRLGLVKEEYVGADANGQPIYREVTAYKKVAEDASFSFDGVNYLSADNKFNKARRIPSGTNRSDYSAKALEEVSEGIWLDLKGVGRTSIIVRHHVQGGEIKALEDIRDGLIPNLKADLDEIAWSLVTSFNAFQYAGYGIGDNQSATGVAFFDPLRFKSDSASLLKVFDMVKNDVSLIGAATGKLDANGKPAYGQSAGQGNGNNAARMASLKTAKLLNSGSASLGDFYEAYLAKIGSEAGRASLMYSAQKNLTQQIDEQRQSVMGVNIDEEMLDILMFNQAFNAMSRYATTIDEMLDRLINGFGIVGR
jgi:flagellar hook-associated protein FlgK